MVNYNCFRCGKQFKQKCHLLNHLCRKNPCKSILKEITNKDILKLNKIEEYNKKIYNILNLSSKNEDNIFNISSKKNNCCKFCNKILSNYKNKWRHEKTCKMKKLENDMEMVEKILNDNKKLQEQNKDLLEKLLELSKKTKNNTSIKGNNNMNTTNIQINNFDCENVDYFTEKIAFRLAKHYGVMVGKFVELLHFNEKHPENYTIKIKDDKSGLVQILEEGRETNYIMDDFLNQVSHNLKDKLFELNTVVPDERQEEFELLYDEAMEFVEKLKNDKKVRKRIKAACINGTNKIHKEKL